MPNGEWDDVAELMMLNFSESGHSVFRGTSPLERGILRSKEIGKLSVTSVVILKLLKLFFVLSFPVKQLSICGAVVDMCEELDSKISDCPASTGKPVAEEKPETVVSTTDMSTTTKPLQISN